MSKLLLLLILAAAPSWAINCSGLVVDEVTPHSVTVHLTTDTSIFFSKLRYGTASLTENVEGAPGSSFPSGVGQVRTQATGLLSATTYLIGLSVSVTDPAGYCTELTTSITTPAEDANLLPLPPTDFDANTVKPQGGTVYTAVSCADVAAKLQVVGHHASGGVPTATADTLLIPPSLNCDVTNASDVPDTIWHFNVDGRVGGWVCCWISSGNLMTSSIPHGLSVGDQVYFGGQFNFSGPPSPIAFSHPYYVIAAGYGTNTIEVSLTSGGSVVPLTSSGSLFLVAKGQGCSSEVLITTQSVVGPPSGVETDDTDYGPTYATLTNRRLITESTRAFDMGWGSPSCVRFANIKFIQDNSRGQVGAVDVDPGLVATFFTFESGNGNHDVTFDRNVMKGANDAPNRSIGFIGPFDGVRMAAVNNYVQDMSIWSPFTDMPTTTAGGTLTIGSGKTYRGMVGAISGVAQPCSNSGAVNFTGGSGAFWVVVNQSDCSIHVVSDPSDTLTFSSCIPSCVHDTSGNNLCGQAFSLANYPLNSAGKFCNIALGYGTLTSGTISAWQNANTGGCCFGLSAIGTESSSSFVFWSKGPGPTKIENNYLHNCIGICAYSTGETCDSGGIGCDSTIPMLDPPSNAIVRRNTFYYDEAHISSRPSFNQKGVWGGRNTLELKWCLKCLVEGNRFINVPATNIALSTAMTFSSLSVTPAGTLTAATEQDIEARYNTITNASQVFEITSRYPNAPYAGFPTRRIWVHDNIATLNGAYQFTQNHLGLGIGTFVLTEGGYNQRFDHNTVAYSFGAGGLLINPAFMRFANFNWSNNLTFINDTNAYDGLVYSDPVPTFPVWQGITALAALNAGAGTSGPLFPGYIFANNANICGYVDSSVPTDMTQAQCDTLRNKYCVSGNCANSGSVTSSAYWPRGSSMAARLATVGFYSYTVPGSPVDLRLNYHSPFISGAGTSTDGLDIGAGIDALNAAQGQVSNVRVISVTSSSAIVNFLAPDSFACTVDWSTNGTLAPFTRVANASSGRIQAVTLSGLPSSTVIFYRVNCASQQPSGGFRTR